MTNPVESSARLRRLGDGVAIDDICREDGIDRAAFDAWWAAECARRLPATDGEAAQRVSAPVRILRDGRGVPHIFAENDHDLFVGYGYAMAQDRLFQMDLRRRRSAGRLAEVLGEAGVDPDMLARTLDHHRLAEAEYGRLPEETRGLFDAFADGVNAAADAVADRLPIEFDLLGYRPEPWTGLDCVRCVVAWRWQLTGRPWVISVPELAKRTLGTGPLYDAFIAFQREHDDESIVPAGESTAQDAPLWPLDVARGGRSASATGRVPAGAGASAFVGSAGVVEPMGGSNNWVVGGSRSRSGKPIVASDPHMPYEASSSFYEVHLSGGSFEVAGAGFVGYPGLTFGRTQHLAWGITNNLCSQRDLYLESDPAAVSQERDEVIHVRGRAEPLQLAVQVSGRGPIVDRILPATANPSGPAAMRWVGQLACDWPSAQLRLNRALSVETALTAVRGWLSPTFSLILADDHGADGHIAFTNTGTIPVRGRIERAYRDPSNPDDAWQGLIPPEGMPQTRDPKVGWIASANNRPVRDDEFPHPLSGTWDEGLRHRRIGQLIESIGPHDRDTFSRIHTDVNSGRANDHLDGLLVTLADRGGLSAWEQQAVDILRSWDHAAAVDSVGAAIWEVFWSRWVQAVAAAHFPPQSADFIANWLNGYAGRLLSANEAGWFPSEHDRESALIGALREALGQLRTALGDEPKAWRWGALHRLELHHPLSSLGDLRGLLDQPMREVGGEVASVNNSGIAATRIPAAGAKNWEATGGAGYRLFADLGDPHRSLWSVTAEGQSGNPGSPNRSDQLDGFIAGRYQEIPLDRRRAEAAARHRLTIRPAPMPHG